MTYLKIEEIKKHLNIDEDFIDDDLYLEALGEAAEEVVCKYIDQPLQQLENEEHEIPKPLIFAMLLWIGTAYAVRESVSSSNMTAVPHSFEMLCDLYRNYSYKKSNYKADLDRETAKKDEEEEDKNIE